LRHGVECQQVSDDPHDALRHVLYTTVDAQCDKLTTVVGRTELTTLATVDVPWRDFSKSGVWDKVPEGSTHSFEDTRIPLQYSAG